MSWADRSKRVMRSSTGALGRELLKRADQPLRALTVGRFTIMWNGKESDVRRALSFEETREPAKQREKERKRDQE